MDINLLKSSTEDQMDLMTMMEMEKLPGFSTCDSFAGSVATPELPPIQFPSPDNGAVFTGNCNISDSSHVFHNPCSSMPFSAHVKDIGFSPFSDTITGKPRNQVDGSSKRNSMVTMREMIFRIAAMQPIHIDPESVKPPKRKNVKISKDPQSVAARHRRERISERIRILQRLVPGGTKMDTASMLDEAIHYVKFLKTQVQSLERATANRTTSTNSSTMPSRFGFPAVSHVNFSSFPRHYQMSSPSQLLNSKQTCLRGAGLV